MTLSVFCLCRNCSLAPWKELLPRTLLLSTFCWPEAESECADGVTRDGQLPDRAGRCIASHIVGYCCSSCGGLRLGMAPRRPHMTQVLSRPWAQKAATTSRRKAITALAWALVAQLLCRVDAQGVSQAAYAQRQQGSVGSLSPVAVADSQATQPAFFSPQPTYSSAAGGASGLSPQLWWPGSDTTAFAAPTVKPATPQAASTSVEDTVFTPGMLPLDTSGNWVCA